MSQLPLYLPSETFLQEYECFELLYARCVQGAAWKDTQNGRSAVVMHRGSAKALEHLPISLRFDSVGRPGIPEIGSRNQALPPCTERA